MSVRPSESVAVSFNSRYEGYSWSGAAKLPDATPLKVSTVWTWQSAAQWWMIRSQRNPEAGMVPSWVSVALPEKPIVSLTFQVRLPDGVARAAEGGVFPAVISSGSLTAETPWLSVTRSRTSTVPDCV